MRVFMGDFRRFNHPKFKKLLNLIKINFAFIKHHQMSDQSNSKKSIEPKKRITKKDHHDYIFIESLFSSNVSYCNTCKSDVFDYQLNKNLKVCPNDPRVAKKISRETKKTSDQSDEAKQPHKKQKTQSSDETNEHKDIDTSPKRHEFVGEFFQHYKNKELYYVVSVSKHTETEDMLITYCQLYDSNCYPFGYMWTRPLKMFMEKVDGVDRFTRVDTPKGDPMFTKFVLFKYDFLNYEEKHKK